MLASTNQCLTTKVVSGQALSSIQRASITLPLAYDLFVQWLPEKCEQHDPFHVPV